MKGVNQTPTIANWNISYRWKDIVFTSYQDVLLPMQDISRVLNQIDLDIVEVSELKNGIMFVKIPKSESKKYKLRGDKEYAETIKWTSIMNPKKVDGKYQIWEILWGFEYNDFEYFIISNTYELTDETIPERGIYKWVVVKPELYFSDKAQRQVDAWALAANKIIGRW